MRNNKDNKKINHEFKLLNGRNDLKNKKYSNLIYHSDTETIEHEIEQQKRKSKSTNLEDSISRNKVDNNKIKHDSYTYKYQF